MVTCSPRVHLSASWQVRPRAATSGQTKISRSKKRGLRAQRAAVRRAATATQQLKKACLFLDAGPSEVDTSNPFEVLMAKFGLHELSSQMAGTQLRFQDCVKSEIARFELFFSLRLAKHDAHITVLFAKMSTPQLCLPRKRNIEELVPDFEAKIPKL